MSLIITPFALGECGDLASHTVHDSGYHNQTQHSELQDLWETG